MTGDEFYALLKEKKYTHGITQGDVGKALGMAYQSVQMYFKYKEKEIDWNYSYIPILAELLEEPVERFLPRTGRTANVYATGNSNAVSMYGGKAATATVGGGTVLSPQEQILITELRAKDQKEVLIRCLLAYLLQVEAIAESDGIRLRGIFADLLKNSEEEKQK